MAKPTISLITPDESVIKTTLPSLEFAGIDTDGHSLDYAVNILGRSGVASSSASNTNRTLAFNGEDFMAVFSDRFIYKSHDGVSWQTTGVQIHASSHVTPPNSVSAYNGSTYVIPTINTSTSIAMISTYTEGEGMSHYTVSVGTNSSPHTIIYANGLFVAVGYYGNTTTTLRILTSPDGKVWTDRSITGMSARGSSSIKMIHTGSKFFIVWDGNTTGTDAIVESYDGITWTVTPGLSILTGTTINSLAFYAGRYMVGGMRNTGSNSRRMATSTDGITWTDFGPSAYASPDRGVRGMNYDNGILTVVMTPMSGSITNSYLMTSYDDGATWSSLSVPDDPAYRIVMGNGRMVVASGLSIESFVNISSFSSSEAGFESLDSPGSPSPFPSGDEIRYTAINNIPQGIYDWSARPIDAGGELGDWAEPREMSIVRPPNPGIFMQFLT